MQVNVIDINDQIPVFEKSDVSSCHCCFFFTLFILLDPDFWNKDTDSKERCQTSQVALVNALVTNADTFFSGNLQGTITFTVVVSGNICL